jgi:mannose-1-phosphate guanylyltransferase
MIGLIMAGGSGTRFWPLSRKNNPKQFLNLFENKSMIQMTYQRLITFIANEDIYVITTIDQARLVNQHLPQLPKKNIIIEPYAMNTAACVAYSVNYLNTLYPGDTDLLIVPSDQLIKEADIFKDSISKAVTLSQKGYHVVFGIEPTYPATGYGYIEKGALIEDQMFHVKHFKEKPDKHTAHTFIKTGNFFWNCGMFLWKLSTITGSFHKNYSEGMEILDEITTFDYRIEQYFKIRALYRKLPKLPIDIAIMEKVDQRAIVPLRIHWSDVGSWYSLHEVSEKDDNENKFFSEHISINSKNNLIYSKKLVCMVDTEDLIVVETDDSILVLPRTSSEKVKDVVEEIKQRKLNSLL